MAKLTLSDITSGYGSVAKLNANNTATEQAMENTLSRDGTGPNEMLANLDMNGRRVLNLPSAVSDTEPVTLSQANILAGVENPLTQATVGAVLYPRTDAEVTAAVTPTNYAYPPGNVLRYGTNTTPGTTNMAAAIQAAFDQCAQGGAEVFIPPVTYLSTSALTLYSNTRIRAYGATINFNTAATNCIIGVDGVTGVDWEGGTFVSITPADTQSCFVLRNGATNNRVVAEKIQDFRNKGMVVITACHRNYIQCFDVSGSTGTDGVGFSIHGAFPNDCTYNTIGPSWAHDCRAGFTFNGGKYNRMLSPLVTNCTLIGVSMDGVVGDGSSGDGDGPKYCYVENPVCINSSSAAYGGVYLGNGASWNTITGAYCFNNLGAGIRSSGGVGWECRGNTIIGAVCDGNATNGVNLSSAPDTQLIGCIAKNNTGQGVQFFVSDNCQVIGGRADGNTAHGLIIQSAECSVFGFQADDNGSYGIRAATGGSAAATNKFYACAASGNTTANYLFDAGGTVRDCQGFVTENAGTAVLVDGTTTIAVTHGLGYTPALQDLQAVAITNPTSLAGYWVAGITSTQFSINSANTATANVSFAWQARRHA